MKKKITFIVSILFASFLNAQVGINTETPNATLDVVSSPENPDLIDGLIAPRLDGSELQSKNALYGIDQIGTIIYAKSASPEAGNTADITVHVDAPGYYYFDGSVWVKFNYGSGTVIEPWKVQNTTNNAELNTDNIYQQGKVAIGFNENDTISERQFEVKGNMKAEFLDGDNYVYGITTGEQNSLDPNTKENLMYVADNKDLSAATHSSFLGVNKNNVAFMNLDKTDTSNTKFNTVIASSTGDGGLVGLASETSTGKYAYLGGSTWTETVGGQIQTRQTVDGNEIEMELSVRPKFGITFIHSNSDSSTEYGSYTFPTNSPEEGQVLVGSDILGSAGIGRQLEWKNLSDVASQPWKIQNTSNNAELNTDNIYQQGKVAIGFDETDEVSEKQLEVKGDVNLESQDTQGSYHQIVTNTDFAGLGILPTTSISISDVENVMENFATTNLPTFHSGVAIRKGDASLSSTNYFGSIGDLNSAGLHAQTDKDKSVFYAATQNAGNQLTQVLGNSSRDGLNYLKMESINTSNNLARIVLGNNNLKNGQAQIAFQFQSANYAFPRNNGQAGQVLTTNGGTYSTTPVQLEWKDLQDTFILKSPGGNCFKITVSDAGTLATTATTCL